MATIPFSIHTRRAQVANRHLTGFTGGGTFGRWPYLVPTRGSFDYEPIKTRVEDWPFAADAEGIPFDQANLWAISTRVSKVVDIGTGDELGNLQWVTAVPKQLPADYTYKARCGHVDPLIQDFMGPEPLKGVWDSTGGVPVPIYWRGPEGFEPSGGSLWTPMNHNQVAGGLTINSGTVPSATTQYSVSQVLPNHIGLRGIKATLFGVTGSSYQLIVSALPVGDPAPFPGAGDTPTGVVFTGGTTAGSNTTITISENGAMHPATPGTRMDYYVWLKKSGTLTTSSAAADVVWGPRTDVPLWFTATTENRVAPGGIL